MPVFCLCLKHIWPDAAFSEFIDHTEAWLVFFLSEVGSVSPSSGLFFVTLLERLIFNIFGCSESQFL